jgi:hypothetical protein
MKNNAGMLLLGTWLIASGVIGLLGIMVPLSNIVLPIMAILAGVLIILRR